jgi:hypothetical protein
MSDTKADALSPECTKIVFAFKHAFQESLVRQLFDFFFALMAHGVIFVNDTAKAIMYQELPVGSILVASISAFQNALTILGAVCRHNFVVVEAPDVWLTIYKCDKLHTFVASIPHVESKNVIDFSNVVFVIEAPKFLTNDIPTMLRWWHILHMLVEHKIILRIRTTATYGLQFAISSTRCYSCNNTRLLCCMLSTYGQPNKKESFCAECIHTALSTWTPLSIERLYAIKNPDMVELMSLTIQT